MEMLTGYAASHQHPFNIFVHMIGIFLFYLTLDRLFAIVFLILAVTQRNSLATRLRNQCRF